MSPSKTSASDVIICGGGTAGCVLASRLHQKKPSLSITLIEAGKDVSKREHIYKPLEAAYLFGSEIDYAYSTTPQTHLNGKPRANCATKALSGSTAMNSGGWTRGDAADYDEWAELVGDKRWSYSGMLPYFRKTEHHFDPHVDPKHHGTSGPIHISSVTSSGRHYPLREPVRSAWAHVGVQRVADANKGSPKGLAELTENRHNGLRQLASDAYPLHGVHVITETFVQRVIIEEHGVHKVATGVELSDGLVLHAKQVILSCSAYRTPQVLMLSGIGPKDTLAKHEIERVIDSPFVGKNFHDHMMVSRFWKLRHPEKGLAMGSQLWKDPAFQKGLPMDWIATCGVDEEGLRSALAKDHAKADDASRLLKDRCHLEMYVVYAAFGGEKQGLQIPFDGSHIMTSAIGMLPTSRGSISIASKNAKDSPVIDPNYYATHVDRFVQREGQRKLSQLMTETAEGKDLVDHEVTPPGLHKLPADASQEVVDDLVKIAGQTVYHPAGTASMGKVVDSDLNVYGVKGLKVIDASVIPVPLAAHYQCCVYALAEQAADIVAAEAQGGFVAKVLHHTAGGH
ncbi:MAG: hypothetical protein Q9162_002422 [Coniocarpon cinnabarinum]